MHRHMEGLLFVQIETYRHVLWKLTIKTEEKNRMGGRRKRRSCLGRWRRLHTVQHTNQNPKPKEKHTERINLDTQHSI